MCRVQVFVVAGAVAAALSEPAAAQDGDVVKRGAYLVNGPGACANCHATRNPDFSIIAGMEFAGGFHIVDPAFDVYAANITSDRTTGIGDWTDDQIILAIREGVGRDGNIIFPPMPSPTYNSMSDEDVTAIVAYLRTLAPVAHEVAESRWNIPQQALPAAKGAPAPDRSDKVPHGAYIVNAIAHCFECHTPMGAAGPDTSKLGAGGLEITLAPGANIFTSNITPDPETGIGTWTDDQIKNAIVAGVRPDGGHVSPPMPVQWFANMTAEDLDAVVAYLRTVPAVSNKVERSAFQIKNFP